MIHDLIAWSGFFIVWIDTFLRYFKSNYGNRFNSAFFYALNAFQIANSGILVDFQAIDLLVVWFFYVFPFQYFYFFFDKTQDELDYFLTLLQEIEVEYLDEKSKTGEMFRSIEKRFGSVNVKIDFKDIAQKFIDYYIYAIIVIFLVQFMGLYFAGYFGV